MNVFQLINGKWCSCKIAIYSGDQILVQDAVMPLGSQIDETLSWFLSLKRIESLRKVRKWGDEYICFPDGWYLR